MSDKKRNLIQDVNFLEYPSFAVNQRCVKNRLVMEKENGRYEVIAALGMPNYFDKIVLYYILQEVYKNNKFTKCSLITNRHQIAKNVFFNVKSIGKHKYDRIMLSLKKWTAVTIDFEGLFFEKDGYSSRCFHFIDETTLKKESGELTIRLNEGYLRQLRETKFYKYIDFEQFKKFSRASSARLYEVLIKSFKASSKWVINIKKLAEKLTLEKRVSTKDYYQSDVLRQLNPSVKEINEKTDLKLLFQYDKSSGTCIFKKVVRAKKDFIPAISAKEKKERENLSKHRIVMCSEHFLTLSEQKQQEIRKDIKRQPLFEYLPDDQTRIYAYMTQHGLWASK